MFKNVIPKFFEFGNGLRWNKRLRDIILKASIRLKDELIFSIEKQLCLHRIQKRWSVLPRKNSCKIFIEKKEGDLWGSLV